MISIHASRGGSDLIPCKVPDIPIGFQSTLPAGEATFSQRRNHHIFLISIHASRGGSDNRQSAVRLCCAISIHASRGGSDTDIESTTSWDIHFNPRFPRGKRPIKHRAGDLSSRFQSTLPAGEATAALKSNITNGVISIHASRGGSDRSS